MAECVSNDVVSQNSMMPGLGQTENAVIAARCFEDTHHVCDNSARASFYGSLCRMKTPQIRLQRGRKPSDRFPDGGPVAVGPAADHMAGMPLHMTKIAYGATSLADVQGWFAGRRERGERAFLTTRYCPKRHAEMVGGSLYWIVAHRIVARSPILSFDAAPDGRTEIVIEPRVIPVVTKPKRAHQGWRYLEEQDAPADLGGDAADALAEMPGNLLGELTKLGLV